MPARRIRPFRLGLWLGVIAAVVWFVQRQRAGTDAITPTRDWTPVPPAEPAARVAPAPSVTPPPAEPAVTSSEPAQPAPEPVPELEPDHAPPAAAAPAPPSTPAKKAARKKAVAKKKASARIPAAWVAPDPGGICPPSHPVKAKLSSKLFHLPGMFAYARTNPDRCYRDEATAEADGLSKAKR